MAKEAGISDHSVLRIWRAYGLKPHVVKGFKLSKDTMFVEKVRDIVGLYLNPPDKAIVLCVDEKGVGTLPAHLATTPWHTGATNP